ncbi:MAG TPA: universal stress protein [Gemmatimonadales bacterium]|nr:universal stress protein [Gemmatimonadales bacterium]
MRLLGDRGRSPGGGAPPPLAYGGRLSARRNRAGAALGHLWNSRDRDLSSAERLAADLLVLGRKHHSPRSRLLLGDTADAVARRSRFPCLFVPPAVGDLRSLLVALDGSDRGMVVLQEACGFAREVGAEVQVVTVEHGSADEPWHLAATFPVARSSALQARVLAAFRRQEIPAVAVSIRRGEIVEAVLAEQRETDSDVLVVGYHRGGPPGVLEAGSTARRLAHAAPCAVLTVPL